MFDLYLTDPSLVASASVEIDLGAVRRDENGRPTSLPILPWP